MINTILFLIASLSVVITPSTIIVDPGEDVEVQVRLVDDRGRPVSGYDYDLLVIPFNIARVKDNRVIGLQPGVGVLVATVRYKGNVYTEYGVVSVGRLRRLRVVVEPRRADVAPGDTVRFRAFVRLPRRRMLVKPDAVDWVVLPSSIGSVRQDGLFTAGNQKGLGRVVAVAELNGVKGIGSAGILVGDLKDNIYRVHLTPRFAKIESGDTLTFDYRVENPDGRHLKVKWFVDPPFVGHFEGNRFIPDVERGRGAVLLWVEDAEGKFGISRGVVLIGRPRRSPPRMMRRRP